MQGTRNTQIKCPTAQDVESRKPIRWVYGEYLKNDSQPTSDFKPRDTFVSKYVAPKQANSKEQTIEGMIQDCNF